MTDIKIMVEAVRQLNIAWNECSRNAEEDNPSEMYNAMCEIDEAVINLVEKIGEAMKVIAINEMLNK